MRDSEDTERGIIKRRLRLYIRGVRVEDQWKGQGKKQESRGISTTKEKGTGKKTFGGQEDQRENSVKAHDGFPL